MASFLMAGFKTAGCILTGATMGGIVVRFVLGYCLRHCLPSALLLQPLSCRKQVTPPFQRTHSHLGCGQGFLPRFLRGWEAS